MGKAIGIRLSTDLLKKIDKIKEEDSDRSEIIRKLISLGYKEFLKKKAFEDYIQERVTISEAARRAELTIWEFMEYLKSREYKSPYSIQDLEEETKLFESIAKKSK